MLGIVVYSPKDKLTGKIINFFYKHKVAKKEELKHKIHLSTTRPRALQLFESFVIQVLSLLVMGWGGRGEGACTRLFCLGSEERLV